MRLVPEQIDEGAELNYNDCSPAPPQSAPAGTRGRLSIERTYEELVRRLKKAHEDGDDFEESVI